MELSISDEWEGGQEGRVLIGRSDGNGLLCRGLEGDLLV